MGRDVHVHLEVKVEGKWRHYSTSDPDRVYWAFELLQADRAHPRGLPRDATFVTKFRTRLWGGDGHSHDYVTKDELDELARRFELATKDHGSYYKTLDDWLRLHVFDSCVYMPEDWPPGVQDVRLVYWFDN